MSTKAKTKPADIVFDDLAAPRLTRLQKLALNGSKNAKVTFTQEEVLSAAKDATGLTDFGPRPFHEALQVLLDDYASDVGLSGVCLLYTSPSPRDKRQSRMPSSA